MKQLFQFWVLFICVSVYGSHLNTTAVYYSEPIAELLEKAEQLKRKKDYNKAILIYNQALKVASEQQLSTDISFIYKKIGDIYYAQKKYYKAKTYLHHSIALDSLGMYLRDTHLSLALLYRKENNKDSLLIHLGAAVNHYQKQEDSKNKFSTFLKAGIIYKNMGNYDQAMRYLIPAYEGFSKLGLQEKAASVSNTIAALQRLLGHYEVSKTYYKKALTIRTQLGDSLKISYSHNNLANVFRDSEAYDSAVFHYNQAIKLQPKSKLNKELGKYHYNLGSVYALQNNIPLASKAYQKALGIKKILGDSLAFANVYNELAYVALQQNKNTVAKRYLDSSKVMLNIKQNSEVLLRHYALQSQYFEQIKDYNNALLFSKKHNALYERVFSEQQAKAVQELQEKFESKQKSEKINTLTQGNNKQKAIISSQEKDIWLRNLIILICIILIILTGLLYVIFKQKLKVNEKKQELHRLESIFKGQEAIKEKIGKDLHDIVTTSYDGIRLKILALPNAKNPKDLGERIVNEIAEVNTEIRLISHRISPLWSKVKDHLLTDIIVEQLTEFQYFRKIFVDIQLPLPTIINDFSLESQTNFYGILLEALNNIHEHAQATEVYIKHQKSKNNLCFKIIDNGIGFEQIHVHSGIGLLNMKQRSELLLGDLIIDSSDKGTTIALEFPIKANINTL